MDRRYVREIAESDRSVGGWHEMVGDDNATLCQLALQPAAYQHQRGTGFPNGRVCPTCLNEREWLDNAKDAVIRETAGRPKGW